MDTRREQRSLAMISLNEDDDRLSALPEDIASRILSLMPTKSAVRTSILSKRWRYVWVFVTNLDFDFDDIRPSHGNNHVPSEFVDRIMESCKPSQIRSFRLHFSEKWVRGSTVSSWIDKAVRLNVSEVDITVKQVKLPLSLFTCTTLTKLRIDLYIPSHVGWNCPCPVNLPCLKTLDIVVTCNPSQNVFKLIDGSPILESLSINLTCCYEKGDYIFNIPSLKRFKLTMFRCESVINKVVLNLPNLEYLFVGGTLGSHFVMKDLSSLVEATISVRAINSEHLLLELLKAINGVESLSISIVPTKRMCGYRIHYIKDKFTGALPIFANMKHLEFKSLWYNGLVLQFLQNSPKLKYLSIEEFEYSPWIDKPKLVPACMLTDLTTIKLSSYTRGGDTGIEFLEYMIRNAKVLKKITVTEGCYLNEEIKKLLELQGACSDCDIIYNYRSMDFC